MLLKANEDTDLKEYEKDEILNMISDDIMIENLVEQIRKIKLNIITDNPISDKLQYFIDKYNFIVTKYFDKQDMIKECNDIMDTILNKILDTINEVMNIKIEIMESVLFKDKIDYVHYLYNFLVVNLSNNIINFSYNYIIDNSESLKKSFKIKNKKSLSYMTIKKLIDNEYTPIILYTETILKSVRDITDEDVINLLIKNDEDEINNYYSRKILVDNYFSSVSFNEPFIDFIRGIIKETDKIYLKVQFKLINNFKERGQNNDS